ncbi:MAG: PIN domain-containing protein [Patescibacteria group bacterium]
MKYLIDSDFLFGLYVIHAPHHKETTRLFKRIQKNEYKLVILNLVIQETATVLSKKDKQETALTFLDEIVKMPVEIMNFRDEDEKIAWKIFKKQTKKGTSFIDCANLAIAQKYKFDGILSFDDFYPKEVRVR